MTKLLMTVFAMVGLTMTSGSWVANHSGASIVHADEFGGRVQLAGAYMPAMADAQVLMAEACHGRFEFVELGEAVAFRCKSHGALQAAGGIEVAMGGNSKAL